LTPLVTYNWEVRANCGSSSSPARLGPQFTTQSPCGTPSRLSATNITTNSATLSWGTVSNANSYNVQYKQSTSANWIPVATGIPSPSYILGALAAATSYDWRVSANCNEGTGLYAQASFVTAPPVCNDVYEPNDESGQARSITFGTTISAGISSTNDVDWFKVTMPNNPNTPLLVTLINLPADYDLYVYNKNLMLVGSSANIGASNETVSYYSHIRSAAYYVKVIGKNGAYNVGQCYNLLAQAVVSGGPVTRATNPANEIIDNSGQLLYPNPASEFVQLSFNSVAEGKSDVQIVNNVGQLVKQYPVNITKGYNQVMIPVKNIRPGMYILKINKYGLNFIRRFVIAR
jgi:Secretion system C-terminal sorting domain/Fibronectin type III domain